jgi:hypothetical protein
VSRRRVIGPIFFHDTINGARYRELQFSYFQQDGATAHTTRVNLAYLEGFYVDRIISRGLNPEWPLVLLT